MEKSTLRKGNRIVTSEQAKPKMIESKIFHLKKI